MKPDGELGTYACLLLFYDTLKCCRAGTHFGWQKSCELDTFALILFFTFLTSYVLFSGKIKACGCFGDCIPLTPIQTFTKDIIVLLLSLVILFNQKYILPLARPAVSGVLVLLATLATLALQFYVMKYLPITDCLAYKKGNNLLELRKMPPGAIPDKYSMIFVYQKNGEKKEFTPDALPDSSWEFVDRQQKLVEAGKNNVPLINDFILTTANGEDSTEAILNQPGRIIYCSLRTWRPCLQTSKRTRTCSAAAKKGLPFHVVTARRELLKNRYTGVAVNGEPVNIPVLTASHGYQTAARETWFCIRCKGPSCRKNGVGNFGKGQL